MACKIELQSLEFYPPNDDGGRLGKAVWRISRNGRAPFDLPAEIFVAKDADEADAVRYARAVLHSLTSELADQTKEWALP